MKIIYKIVFLIAIFLLAMFVYSKTIKVESTYPLEGESLDKEVGPLSFKLKSNAVGFLSITTKENTHGSSRYDKANKTVTYTPKDEYKLNEPYIATLRFMGIFKIDDLAFYGQVISTDPVVYEINTGVMGNYYPLAPFLPYSTSEYSITYTDRKVLEIEVKNPVGGKDYKQVVDKFASDNGVDISDHEIVVKTK